MADLDGARSGCEIAALPAIDPGWLGDAMAGTWQIAPRRDAAALRGVCTDTREPIEGCVFVALRGPNHDGHDHLDAAVAAGAALLVVDRASAAAPAVPTLIVPDTLAALQRAAHAHRQRLIATTVIAVTGSAGKTTTRRLIAAALSARFRGHQAPKSFNNAVGVPLTLLGATEADRFLVVEIGTNAPGEIEALGHLVEPDIVVLTGVGHAHLGGFGSIEAIAAEKASLLRCRRPGGVVVARSGVPVLDPHLRGVEPLIRFGTDAAATVRLLDRTPTADGQHIVVEGPLEIDLPLSGEHNAINALAAIAVARAVGLDETEIAAGLAVVEGASMRLERIVVPVLDGPPVMIINDAYNANPESMIAALATFIEMSPAAQRRRLFLGCMLELGAESPRLHAEVLAAVATMVMRAPATIESVTLVGAEWSSAVTELAGRWGENRVRHFERADETALAAMAASVAPGDAILLKGSRGVALERLAALIRARGAASAGGSRS